MFLVDGATLPKDACNRHGLQSRCEKTVIATASNIYSIGQKDVPLRSQTVSGKSTKDRRRRRVALGAPPGGRVVRLGRRTARVFAGRRHRSNGHRPRRGDLRRVGTVHRRPLRPRRAVLQPILRHPLSDGRSVGRQHPWRGRVSRTGFARRRRTGRRPLGDGFPRHRRVDGHSDTRSRAARIVRRHPETSANTGH